MRRDQDGARRAPAPGDGRPGGDGSDELTHLPDPDRVQSVRRLVEDEQVRIAEQGGADGEALLHAEGVRPYLVRAAAGESDLVEDPVHPRRVLPAQHGEGGEVAGTGQRRVQRGALDQGAHPWQVAGRCHQGMTEDGPGAPAGADQAEQHAQGRRLAGPVGPDESGDDPLGNREVETGDDGPAPVPLGQTLDVDGGRPVCLRCRSGGVGPGGAG